MSMSNAHVQVIEITDPRAGRLQVEYALIEGSSARPLLVFLHEGLGSVAMWRDFPQRLCAACDMRGLVYSRPGYGGSTPRAADQAWPADFLHHQAQVILPSVLQSLGISDDIYIFGHSDGGSMAIIYAATFPEKTRGVMLLAPHVDVEQEALESIQSARETFESTDLRTRLARYHADVDSAFYGWNTVWLSEAFKDFNLHAMLPKLRCPVLAVQGEDDEYATLAQIQRILQHAPQTQLLVLPNCGHSAHRDCPDEVIKACQALVFEPN